METRPNCGGASRNASSLFSHWPAFGDILDAGARHMLTAPSESPRKPPVASRRFSLPWVARTSTTAVRPL